MKSIETVKCDNCPYKSKYKDIEVLRLFFGMSDTMQEALIQIMKVTQLGANNGTDVDDTN